MQPEAHRNRCMHVPKKKMVYACAKKKRRRKKKQESSSKVEVMCNVNTLDVNAKLALQNIQGVKRSPPHFSPEREIETTVMEESRKHILASKVQRGYYN